MLWGRARWVGVLFAATRPNVSEMASAESFGRTASRPALGANRGKDEGRGRWSGRLPTLARHVRGWPAGRRRRGPGTPRSIPCHGTPILTQLGDTNCYAGNRLLQTAWSSELASCPPSWVATSLRPHSLLLLLAALGCPPPCRRRLLVTFAQAFCPSRAFDRGTVIDGNQVIRLPGGMNY
jgi:hypothetical protein